MAGDSWGTTGEAPSCRSTAQPHLDESAETGLFLLGYFSPPLLFLFFFHVCGEGRFLLKYLVLPSLVTNLVLQKNVLDTLV